MQKTARNHGVNPVPFSKPLPRRLMDYAWPGNVRELSNIVERMLLLSDSDQVVIDDLPHPLQSPTTVD